LPAPREDDAPRVLIVRKPDAQAVAVSMASRSTCGAITRTTALVSRPRGSGSIVNSSAG
jgi:hypothetical protein